MMGKHILSQKNILYCMTVFMYDHIENSLFYPSYYPSYRVKFPVIIKRGKFSSTFFFCMAVSALENNDECRKHVFSMPPESSEQKFPVTSIKSGFLWPMF